MRTESNPLMTMRRIISKRILRESPLLSASNQSMMMRRIRTTKILKPKRESPMKKKSLTMSPLPNLPPRSRLQTNGSARLITTTIITWISRRKLMFFQILPTSLALSQRTSLPKRLSQRPRLLRRPKRLARRLKRRIRNSPLRTM